MPRGLDHIVHVVRDLDAAADAYRSLGFTVGARNRHAWGTHNHIVQFPGFFIEILTVAEPEKLGDDGFSVMFGEHHQRFLERHEGFSMLLLESQDASADEREFVRARIAASSAMRFEREARRPDGTEVKVAFSLAFARDPDAPDIGLAVCQQHYPENFWNPDFQHHANGATGVRGVVMVASDPAEHARVMSAFAGGEACQFSSDQFTIQTPRGDITVTKPAVFQDRFGVAAPDVSEGARLAALRLAVKVGSAAPVVASDQLFGATLVFEAVEPR
ncbi:MAG: VOC family protein [Pseudorhodoplanes sp.]